METWGIRQFESVAATRLDAEFWLYSHTPAESGDGNQAKLLSLNDELDALTKAANLIESAIVANRSVLGQPCSNSDWPSVPLGDLCDMHVGCNIVRSDCQAEQGGAYHVFRAGSIAVGGGLSRHAHRWIPRNKCPNPRRFVLHKNDIVMALTEKGTAASRLALLGHSALIDQDDLYVLTKRTAKITVKDASRLDVVYLFYFTNRPAFIRQLHQLATGTVQSNLSLPDVNKSLVVLPPIEEQRRIAAVGCS